MQARVAEQQRGGSRRDRAGRPRSPCPAGVARTGSCGRRPRARRGGPVLRDDQRRAPHGHARTRPVAERGPDRRLDRSRPRRRRVGRRRRAAASAPASPGSRGPSTGPGPDGLYVDATPARAPYDPVQAMDALFQQSPTVPGAEVVPRNASNRVASLTYADARGPPRHGDGGRADPPHRAGRSRPGAAVGRAPGSGPPPRPSRVAVRC